MKFAGVDSSAVGVRCFPQIGQYIADGDSQTVRLPGRDGELFLSATQGPAEFPITVRADAADAAAARTLLDGVAEWLARGPAQLVFDELPDRYWTARLRGGLAWSLGAGSYRVVSNIVMRADDPHAYALTDDTAVLTAPGAVARTKGNTPSRPTVWVTGTLTGGQSVTLNLWGKTVTLTGPLSAGEVALLDYRDYTFRVVALTWTEVARNLAANPSFEATSGTVEVRRNLVVNPVGGAAVSGSVWTLKDQWFGASPGAGIVAKIDTPVTLPDGTVAPSFQRKTWTAVPAIALSIAWQFYRGDSELCPVTAGIPYVLQYAFRHSWGPGGFIQNRWIIEYWNGPTTSGNTQVGATQYVNLTDPSPTADTWQQASHAFTPPAGATHCKIAHQINVNNGVVVVGSTIDATAVCLGTANVRELPFWGGYSPDSDLTPAWVGADNASASVLTAPRCAGPLSGPYGVKDFQSGLWALSGAKSYRQTTTREAGERLSMLVGGFDTLMGLTPGKTYTILATCRLTAPLTAVTPGQPIRLALRWQSGRVYSAPVPNEAGVHPVRFVATLPAAATGAMIEANMWGAGNVWWDNLAIVEGEYTGPAFNGSTTSSGPDISYAWVGTPNASQSIKRALSGTTPIRNLAGKLSNLARINCPVGGGPVSWTTTGSVSQVAIACNSRWI